MSPFQWYQITSSASSVSRTTANSSALKSEVYRSSDRKLSEKRIFPAIDISRSGTRRDDLLLSAEELETVEIMRKALNGLRNEEAAERIIELFCKTRNNADLVNIVRARKYV